MDELHRQLLQIGFDAGHDLGLVLAGGYALAAYDLVDRPSRDVDCATATSLPLSEVVLRLCVPGTLPGFSWKTLQTGWAPSTSSTIGPSFRMGSMRPKCVDCDDGRRTGRLTFELG